MLFFAPLGAMISRHGERQADRGSFTLMGKAAAMIGALKRLARDNLANLHPHPLYAWFHASHPPLLERIAYLETLEHAAKGDLRR
jgi:STE24 endopeptidase